MPKQIFQGKEGVWRTMPNGNHIFIPDGETLDSVLSKMEETAQNQYYDKAQTIDALINRITFVELYRKYFNNGQRIMPKKYARLMLNRALEFKDDCDPEIESLVYHCISKSTNIMEFQINDRGTNWYKAYNRRLQINIHDPLYEINCSIGHEVGHAIDCSAPGYHFLSSTFKSPKYGKTLSEMFKEEFTDIDLIQDEYDEFKHQEKFMKDEGFDYTMKWMAAKNAYRTAAANMADMYQAVFGDKECTDRFGWIPHVTGYFKDDPENLGTELFAELTESLFNDKNKTFYNAIKEQCPKSIEVYREIIKEVKKKWRI